MATKVTTAKKEGFQVLTDPDLLAGVEGRVRQLEAERAGHMLFLSEAHALNDENAIKDHTDTIKDLETRLKVTYDRRNTLMANMDTPVTPVTP